ncbi:LysR family transcriptional regulator [Nocardia sp. NPDC056100]|uniref:helix-turn-helix domain-containing protein n=1 Tax=Nocardia sp. NPDC056100 TaxID=3345712 RepID=UPI0035E33A6A
MTCSVVPMKSFNIGACETRLSFTSAPAVGKSNEATIIHLPPPLAHRILSSRVLGSFPVPGSARAHSARSHQRTVAEELHFGKAAQRLYLSTERVSQSIKNQERRIGGMLIERTR